MIAKNLFWIFLLLGPAIALACPNCAGSENAQDKYTVYILATFIILIYIPFYMILKMAFKHKKKS